MADLFLDGYKAFLANSANAVGMANGVAVSDRFLGAVNKAIEQLAEEPDSRLTSNRAIAFDKGFAAEGWHSQTFNLDAIIKGNEVHSYVPESNALGSVDIKISDGQDISSKFYSTARNSALAQSDPNYTGQGRLIPTEQLDEARRSLETILEKYPDDPVIVDALSNLTDRIKSESIESQPVTVEEMRALTEAAKNGKIDRNDPSLKFLDDYLNKQEWNAFAHTLDEALMAGVEAATLAMLVQIAPQIVNVISEMIRNGEVEIEDFKEVGFAALDAAPNAFIRGFTTSALTSLCQSGAIGAAAQSFNPSVLATAVVITMNVAEQSLLLSKGQITPYEFTMRTAKQMFVTVGAAAMGALTQQLIPVPVIGYMLGSLVGSTASSLVFDQGQDIFISLCVEKGYTFFGLVEQDYQLPSYVLEQLGLEIFQPTKADIEELKIDTFTPDALDVDVVQAERIELPMVRRGLMKVNRVGYMS
jgi:hypothetical protein